MLWKVIYEFKVDGVKALFDVNKKRRNKFTLVKASSFIHRCYPGNFAVLWHYTTDTRIIQNPCTRWC